MRYGREIFFGLLGPNGAGKSTLMSLLVGYRDPDGGEIIINGAWFPTSFMPPFFQTLSHASIVYWAMEGFLQVLWRDAGTIEILPQIGVLVVIASAVTLVTVWRFRQGHIL